MPETLSVEQFCTIVNELISQTFAYGIWIEGEVTSLKRASSGHVYFTLVESSDPKKFALPITLFKWDKPKVNKSLQEAGNAIRIEDGLKLRIFGSPNYYSARSSVQIRMTNIDPYFTLGTLAAEKDALIASLRTEGLLDQQRRLSVPPLCQSVGIVTSVGSAAHADVIGELERSELGLNICVADARVQGADAPASIVAAINCLALGDTQPDIILLCRGGGASIDLAAFDNELVARAIATCDVPIWVGIGHEVDHTVADEVAHQRWKTPTGAAWGIVEHNRDAIDRSEHAFQAISNGARSTLDRAEQFLIDRGATIGAAAFRYLDTSDKHIAAIERTIAAYNPQRALERGWTITRIDGKQIGSIANAHDGTHMTTTTADGSIISTVLSSTPNTSEK